MQFVHPYWNALVKQRAALRCKNVLGSIFWVSQAFLPPLFFYHKTFLFKQKLYLLLVAMGCFLAFTSTAQKQKPSPGASITNLNSKEQVCGTDLVLKQLREDPANRLKEERMNSEIQHFVKRTDSGEITLPVVIHIINENPNAVSDQQVIDGLQNLTDAFSKSGSYSGSAGVDTRIRFCLANKDPDGGVTTGITRTNSFFENDMNYFIEDRRLKNLIQWDPSRYINIWYISSLHYEVFTQFSCGTWLRMNAGGYATLPPGGGPLDGIVINEFGRVLVHETGHYLGLYHTFEGLNCANNNCATDGDRVCDTPPDASVRNSSSCNNPDNSCNNDTLSGFTVDMPDQIANFMDYGNDNCHNQFTQGQADRMIATINTQRPGLLQNECDPPCPSNAVAAFARNNAHPVQGDVISFINNSTGAANYEWLVNDAVISTQNNFTYTADNTGKFKITLKAYSATDCFASYTDYVIVNCGVTARFFTDKRVIASKAPLYVDTIRFTNNSYNATSFQWIMGNNLGMQPQVISTTKDLVYAFDNPGTYTVQLIASNGACSDTTDTYFIPVTDPTPDAVAFVTNTDCYEQTRVRVSFYVCNYGYAPLPKNTPVSFYDKDPREAGATKLGTFLLPDSISGLCCGFLYTTILNVGRLGLNQLYVAFNDAGNASPLVYPNTTIPEKNYLNNVQLVQDFAFKVTTTPAVAIMQPGDTTQFVASARPGGISSYIWSSAKYLSCTNCAAPNYIADTTTLSTKRVVATSNFGCTDTGYVTIKVPPYNDYSINLKEVQCSKNDSLHIDFTIGNNFKRGIIPKGLNIAFYNGDPATGTATLLPPVFIVKDSVLAQSANFSTFIKGIPSGNLYLVVNDSGLQQPLTFPASRLFESNYTNNIISKAYSPERVVINPADTTVFRKQLIKYSLGTTIYNASSTVWATTANAINCTNCLSPVMSVLNRDSIKVKTENKYGCVLQGVAAVKIFPPNLQVKILEAKCYANNAARVTFTICLNNGYDSVPANIPVSFYDGDVLNGGRFLSPVFRTKTIQVNNCNTYFTNIALPRTTLLTAIINNTGNTGQTTLVPPFNETDYNDNVSTYPFVPFEVSIYPADTTISRLGSVSLVPQAKGGIIASYSWLPSQFLSCFDCPVPVASPQYTTSYILTARNENACTDTATAIVRTVSGKGVYVPTAFTPNADRLNDVLYVMAGPEVRAITSFTIFDRWGNKIFQAQNVPPNTPVYGWDGLYRGSQAGMGTYVYHVVVKYADGTQENVKGTVVLIR